MDREQQSTRPGAQRATPPKSRTKTAKAKPAGGGSKAAGEATGTSAPDIMSRLPKSRPQRASQRRRAPVAETAKTPAAKATAARTTAAPAKASARAKRPAGRRPVPSGPAVSAPPATTKKDAPGLPRLAIDGATEAVKLPLKVSGRLTLKALDAVARGLRRR